MIGKDDELFDQVDQDIFHVRHQAISALQLLRNEPDAKCRRSNRSSKSSRSSKSNKSVTSSVCNHVLEERLKLAELKAATEFDEETYKLEFETLNHRRELAQSKAAWRL